MKIKEDFGPFLFTPLKFGSIERYNIKSNKMEYVWVINEPCEVILELSNPLNFELEVTNIVSILFIYIVFNLFNNINVNVNFYFSSY